MQRAASEIIFLILKQHFQDQPDSRITELAIKIQKRGNILRDSSHGLDVFPFGISLGFDRSSAGPNRLSAVLKREAQGV
jgi:hypothetical protein